VGKIRLFPDGLLLGRVQFSCAAATAFGVFAKRGHDGNDASEVAPNVANWKTAQIFPGLRRPCHLSSSVAARLPSRPLIGVLGSGAAFCRRVYRFFQPRLLRTRAAKRSLAMILQRTPRKPEKLRCACAPWIVRGSQHARLDQVRMSRRLRPQYNFLKISGPLCPNYLSRVFCAAFAAASL